MTLNTQPGYGVSFYGSIGLAFVKPGSGVDGVSNILEISLQEENDGNLTTTGERG